jgi:3-dehydroquinate synthase
LNFGHSFGHGIEAEEEMKGLYHGECVALGMLPVCSDSVRKRLIPVLKKLGLPTEYAGNVESAFSFVRHDKKATADGISVVLVDEIGSFRIEKIGFDEFYKKVRAVFLYSIRRSGERVYVPKASVEIPRSVVNRAR